MRALIFSSLLCVLCSTAACRSYCSYPSPSERASTEIVSVRPPESIRNKQGLKQFVGISEESSGAEGISLSLVIIPPGGRADAHRHLGYETAVYLLEGEVETFYGDGLRKSIRNVAGDFLFIPANLPHQPVNLSTTNRAVAVVARNDAREQEHVEHYVPASEPESAVTRSERSNKK